ncbi:hypothetical protein SERLADRAFT_437324 [Serpula lacrymans var. lacrymans S7.9]|uniref:Calcineurin-like phosphoesterase domain-containing protein n=1 Tax=Serpula lacrymans var. lacrymans (strain S7.9) TaxID=578457 RepID=F8NTC1_SERL9|nr:uncharacterized protein SERLADRAFT_437324 [Serpula lacrymans var. lacrymans S7.9]EGO25593.1 hypothetical protein SERLADRAFT_437324 [Serpula lacrymans var. lacrymans S7.9]
MRTNLPALLPKGLNAPSSCRTLVNGLRLAWIAVVLWGEVGVFFYNLRSCDWPDRLQPESPDLRSAHILVVADPQVLDHRSYPERGLVLTMLSQFIADLNLRKSWRVTMHRLRPHAVVFLGDMMDGGRTDMDDDEYEAYYERFRSIFALDYVPLPVYYLPGNHDIGLGKSDTFSPDAVKRYVSHFGPLNQRFSVGNHTIMLIDAPSLVQEDYKRVQRGYSFEDWPNVIDGPLEFVKRYKSEEHNSPVILFSHIPLARPPNTNCGPLREKGTIRQGTGLGYQNTLTEPATNYLLKSLRPTLILSGDDHDYCEYAHTLPLLDGSSSVESAKEVSVKSFSMAMGIRRPGFQLLSLTSTVTPDNMVQIPNGPPQDVPCLLPNQLGVYLYAYVPFIVFSLLALFLSNIRRTSARESYRTSSYMRTQNRSRSPRGRSASEEFGNGNVNHVNGNIELSRRLSSRDDVKDVDIHVHERDHDAYVLAPQTERQHGGERRKRSWSLTFTLCGQLRRLTVGPLPHFCGQGDDVRGRNEVELPPREEQGLFRGFSRDVLDVAWPAGAEPLVLGRAI